MKRIPFRRWLAFCMVLCLALGCTACGGTGGGSGASAATMFLRKTAGTVGVADAEGQDVVPAENLGLYSGYTVGTEAESYAWIDLDQVKLAKLDENSAAAITKDGKKLSIDIKSGSLFFNVTEPLADDETMEIRASSMIVGIRGTCGWVEVPDSGTMRVYILEGKVECIAGQNTVTVNAGEMAEMTADGAIEVSAFAAWDVPDFVTEEMKADEALSEAILDASGIDVAGNLQSLYPDVFAGIEQNGEEVRLAEEIDFEADGSPELLVVRTDAEDEMMDYRNHYYVEVYRNGSGRSQRLIRFGLSEWGAETDYTSDTLFLVESEGHLFLLLYENDTKFEVTSLFKQEVYTYWGSAAQSNGDPSYWGRIDCVLYSGRDDNILRYHRCGQSENGLRNGAKGDSTAEEYESVIAQYTEVRVLVGG